MKPTIAIPKTKGGLRQKSAERKYQSCLLSAGMTPCWIETDSVEQAVESALRCDGLLLPGGPDIEPALYGQFPDPLCGKADAARDEVDFAMLKAMLDAKRPILGIGRGMQVINVFFGGTVHQDITQRQKLRHMDPRRRNKSSHTVRLTGGTKLRAIFGEDMLAVNSLHHQAVADIPVELTVAARSGDGFVEALELNWHPFCIGVQWAPEYMAARSPLQGRLFSTFAAACRKTRE